MRTAKKVLTIEEVEFLCHKLARKIMQWDEKIPEFNTRFPGVLESCLLAPWQTYEKKDLYPDIKDKAAILFYLMIKNHPFQNGNKRVAVTSLLTFLFLNEKWLETPPDELYEMAVNVAKSNPKYKDGILSLLKNFIDKNLKDAE